MTMEKNKVTEDNWVRPEYKPMPEYNPDDGYKPMPEFKKGELKPANFDKLEESLTKFFVRYFEYLKSQRAKLEAENNIFKIMFGE
jgi:hypothetical protein